MKQAAEVLVEGRTELCPQDLIPSGLILWGRRRGVSLSGNRHRAGHTVGAPLKILNDSMD